LEEYFDAYLYAANWGTRELAFRLPHALLDVQTAGRRSRPPPMSAIW
jgi:hypothetical protein